MDIFYYSNYCKHSQNVLQFLVKGNLTEKISFICIDKRFYDKKTNQTKISTENGMTTVLPPNVHSVPALLLVNQNYQLLLGDNIIKHYEPVVRKNIMKANLENGEPMGMPIQNISGSGGSNIVSEQYTSYNMTTQELSGKGSGGNRQMFNYVPVDAFDEHHIQTPPDTWKPDKLSGSVTIDNLQKQRNDEIQQSPLFIPSL
jgi:hypothetical protein